MDPPTSHAGTNPSDLGFVNPGAIRCPPGIGIFGVDAPTTQGSFSGIVDAYIAFVWRWDGSQWVGVTWGPLATKPRFSQEWTVADGSSATHLSFTAVPGSWYAATQWYFDAQRGGWLPQMHPGFLGGSQPFCQVG